MPAFLIAALHLLTPAPHGRKPPMARRKTSHKKTSRRTPARSKRTGRFVKR